MATEIVTYPNDDFSKGADLLFEIGSFWTNVFEDSDQLQAKLRALGTEWGQARVNLQETYDAVSRFTIPVFHRENWYLLTLKRSDALKVASIYRPNDWQYGPQDGLGPRPAGMVYNYGDTDRTDILQAPMPKGMVDAPFVLQSRLTVSVQSPGRVLVAGIDYDVDRDRRLIRFRNDPFLDPEIPQDVIYDAVGNPIDVEVRLWAFRTLFDPEYVYNQFGYVLGVRLVSSQGYKDVLNALWDMYVVGGVSEFFDALLSALSGSPRAVGGERVETIFIQGERQLVVTDHNVYEVPATAGLLVAVGDDLIAGQQISDAVRAIDLAAHEYDVTDVAAISLDASFLSGGFFGPLSFRNLNLPLQYVGIDAEGFAEVRFPVEGFPPDVERFWDAIHARGKAQGKVLANYLDLRENPVGPPGPTNLPLNVNPMLFVLNNLMRNGLFLVVMKLGSFQPDAPGPTALKYVRPVLPPHTAFLSYVQLPTVEDATDLGVAGDADDAGASDGPVTGLLATDTLFDSVDANTAGSPSQASRRDRAVMAWVTDENCLEE